MKNIIVILFLLVTGNAIACPVCERNQPKVMQGIVHGAGPDSQWDYVIIAAVTVVVIITLFFSVKWLIQPGEKSSLHIKRTVLNNW